MSRSGTRVTPLPTVGDLFCGAFKYIGVNRIEIEESKKGVKRKIYYFDLKCECGNEIVKKETNLRNSDARFKKGERGKSTYLEA